MELQRIDLASPTTVYCSVHKEQLFHQVTTAIILGKYLISDKFCPICGRNLDLLIEVENLND